VGVIHACGVMVDVLVAWDAAPPERRGQGRIGTVSCRASLVAAGVVFW
jgi:hypothetical protein